VYEILNVEELAPHIKRIKIRASHVAKHARPGQFVILRVDERGERIPLTLYDWSVDEGSITVVFKEVGVSTFKLGSKRPGDYIANVVGPLGRPSEIRLYGTVVCAGGGVGSACVYPVARALREAGNRVITIVGARTKSLLILLDELGSVSDELHVVTDDGSAGFKGFVSDRLKVLLDEGVKVDLVYAVGPVPMMKAVTEVAKEYSVRTIVSLNPIMIDGTGMCGGCRVIVGGKVRFACVDGPEFDGAEVDFDSLMLRLNSYVDLERMALARLGGRLGG